MLSCAANQPPPTLPSRQAGESHQHYGVHQVDSAGRSIFATCRDTACARPTQKSLPSQTAASPTSAQSVQRTEPTSPSVPAASGVQTSTFREKATSDLVEDRLEPTAAPQEATFTITVPFEFAATDLSPSAARVIVQSGAAFRKASSIRITAYTDDRGSVEANRSLAQARALAVMVRVRNSLGENTTRPRLTAVGTPLCCYVAPNETPEGRSQNRRAEIVLETPRSLKPGHNEVAQANVEERP